jgi:hypothetical protein
MQATHTPPTTAAAEATPADLLRGAAAYLNTHGWYQGGFYDPFHTDPFPPACALGALRMAAFGRDDALADLHHTDPTAAIARAARTLLAGHVDPDFSPGGETSSIDIVGDWNDHQTRTATDVTTALEDAADEWDRLHTGVPW